MGSNTESKLILYTNHRCPWAHRAHIALEELKIPFEEVIIDLDRPRDPWYLDVNPRGLVPSLSADGEIITESAIVSQYLVDSNPSHLAPASNSPSGALQRARIAFFSDTWFTKIQNQLFKFYAAKTPEDFDTFVDTVVGALAKEVEPLLQNAGPFFGGSDKLTLAEVLTGSFVVRLVSLTKEGLYPESLGVQIKEKVPKFWSWAEAVAAHPSVRSIYDEPKIIEGTKARIAKARGQT